MINDDEDDIDSGEVGEIPVAHRTKHLVDYIIQMKNRNYLFDLVGWYPYKKVCGRAFGHAIGWQHCIGIVGGPDKWGLERFALGFGYEYL